MDNDKKLYKGNVLLEEQKKQILEELETHRMATEDLKLENRRLARQIGTEN